MFFVSDYRDRIKTENPDVTFGEVGKLLGAKWKEMGEAEKKVTFPPPETGSTDAMAMDSHTKPKRRKIRLER